MSATTEAPRSSVAEGALLTSIEDVEVTFDGFAGSVGDLLTMLRRANIAAATIVNAPVNAAVGQIEILDDDRVELDVRLYGD